MLQLTSRNAFGNSSATYGETDLVFRGRGPAKLTRISGAKYFYRKQTIEGRFSKLETATAMAAVVQANPFLREAGIDESKLHVTFLSDAAPATAEKMLAVLAAKSERFQVRGREIYLCFPDGYGNTKLSNSAIEKKLSVTATTRNWKTVNLLSAMAKSIFEP